MSVVKRQPTAEEDLFEIWSYIADDSIREADKLIRKISETFLLLADNPRMGSRREELAESLRAFPVKSYVIYYRPHDRKEGIVVVRVLNANQNITESHFE
jgi:toxin ParE1/3/4